MPRAAGRLPVPGWVVGVSALVDQAIHRFLDLVPPDAVSEPA